MKILGIDPGLGIVGFGLLDFAGHEASVGADFRPQSHWGVITTSKDRPESARLQEIYEDLTELVSHLAPDVVSIEKLFFFRNATTMVPVSQARGVILLVLQKFGVPVYEYTPMQVKQAMTGYGKASKQEIQQMMMQLLELEKLPRPDDAADALAMALCHYQSVERYQLNTRQQITP
jgi:crossover junction endodeoxyribonuclease RuvC